VFGKRTNSSEPTPERSKHFSSWNVVETFKKFDNVEINSVEHSDDENEPRTVRLTVDKLFNVQADIFGLVNADVGCERVRLGTAFTNDGSVDLKLINGYNSREPNAYAYLTDANAVVCCWADVGLFDHAAAEMNLINAVVWQRRGCREFSILRNHYVKYGSIDNVTIEPSALN
jgi:hypothetical protein